MGALVHHLHLFHNLFIGKLIAFELKVKILIAQLSSIKVSSSGNNRGYVDDVSVKVR